MSGITTHVLDTARGRPAAGVPVRLETRVEGGGWYTLGRGVTDEDGRLRDILPPAQALAEGSYRLTFDTASYFAAEDTVGFYPEVCVTFVVRDPSAHYHVPLLLSPYGYTTYRGS
ncbi:MAG: 5-hydroxyisourate hydrolase [Acidobacteriota bacterium]|jgi:5-hydroxyisourate hydrolase|nr:5-hydroxyisourate hydrolase [Acidobacteriota bacterium]